MNNEYVFEIDFAFNASQCSILVLVPYGSIKRCIVSARDVCVSHDTFVRQKMSMKLGLTYYGGGRKYRLKNPRHNLDISRKA